MMRAIPCEMIADCGLARICGFRLRTSQFPCKDPQSQIRNPKSAMLLWWNRFDEEAVLQACVVGNLENELLGQLMTVPEGVHSHGRIHPLDHVPLAEFNYFAIMNLAVIDDLKFELGRQ